MSDLAKSATVYPVLGAKEILNLPQYQEVLTKLRASIGVDPETYKTLYSPLFYNFAEFVQNFSAAHNAQPGGIINFGFLRALESMQYAFEQKYFADDLRYALLCLALLGDVGEVFSGRRIIICNAEGDFIKYWDPFAELLYAKNRFYRMVEVANLPLQHAKVLTPHFALTVIPPNGQQLIMQNPQLLHKLLVALGQNDDDAEELKGVLDLLSQRVNKKRKIKLSNLDIEGQIPEHMLEAQAFWVWLCESLAQKSIEANEAQSGVHGVKGGVLLDLDILIERFKRERKIKTSSKAIKERFSALGIVGKKVHTYKINTTSATHSSRSTAKAKSSQKSQTTVFGKKGQPVATDFKALAQKSTYQTPYSMVKGGVQFAQLVNHHSRLAQLGMPPVSDILGYTGELNASIDPTPQPGA